MPRFTHTQLVRRISPNVNRGVKLLDKKVPSWYQKISPSLLQMHMPNTCVLGQALPRGYYLGADSINLDGSVEKERHGFTLVDGSGPKAWSVLTELWLDAAHARVKRDRVKQTMRELGAD